MVWLDFHLFILFLLNLNDVKRIWQNAIHLWLWCLFLLFFFCVDWTLNDMKRKKIEREKQDTLVLNNIAIWKLVFQIQLNTLFTFFFFLFFFFCLIKLSIWNGNSKNLYKKYGFRTIFIKFYWKHQQYDKSYCMFTHPLLLPLLIWERAHEIENKN